MISESVFKDTDSFLDLMVSLFIKQKVVDSNPKLYYIIINLKKIKYLLLPLIFGYYFARYVNRIKYKQINITCQTNSI